MCGSFMMAVKNADKELETYGCSLFIVFSCLLGVDFALPFIGIIGIFLGVWPICIGGSYSMCHAVAVS